MSVHLIVYFQGFQQDEGQSILQRNLDVQKQEQSSKGVAQYKTCVVHGTSTWIGANMLEHIYSSSAKYKMITFCTKCTCTIIKINHNEQGKTQTANCKRHGKKY